MAARVNHITRRRIGARRNRWRVTRGTARVQTNETLLDLFEARSEIIRQSRAAAEEVSVVKVNKAAREREMLVAELLRRGFNPKVLELDYTGEEEESEHGRNTAGEALPSSESV